MTFFNILPHSFQILVQSFKKVLFEPQKNILEKVKKGYQKPQNFMLSAKLFMKLRKGLPRKSDTQKAITSTMYD